MDTITRARRIRLGELSSAIGYDTPKAISLWLQRYEHIKPKAEQSGTWAEFCWGDVAAFAIAKYLTDVGMEVPAAFTYATAIVETSFPKLFDEDNPTWKLTVENAIIDFHFGRSTHWPGFDTWGVSKVEAEDMWSRVKRGLDSVGSKDFPARVIVSVFLGHIISDAFESLAEMGHRPPRLVAPT